MIVPVGIACIVSMIIGNHFNHGLYHGLIHTFSMPFLNAEPAEAMYVASVQQIMAHKLIVLPKKATVTEVRELIEKCDSGEVTHNAFPVVDSRACARLAGIVELDELRHALEHADENKQEDATTAVKEAFSSIEKASRQEAFSAIVMADGFVKRLDYADRSPVTVYSHTKVRGNSFTYYMHALDCLP